jgi:hypothetical protein
MPPRTLSSTVVLVGLTSLTAVEAGGFDNRPESLRSATRAGLPLVSQAVGSISAEASYTLADYGVRPIPGLKHVCGHYELLPDGELVSRDLFSATIPAKLLEQVIERAQTPARRNVSRSITLTVSEYTEQQLPPSCRKLAANDSRSLLVATRQL